MKRGVKNLKSALIVLIISVFMLSSIKFDSRAAATTTYNVTGNYDQTSARNMLSIINEMRTSGKAWEYTEDNKIKEHGVLPALEYDYELEKIAMQRAMEVSVRYGHNRPDGRQFSSAWTYKVTCWSENIQGSDYEMGTKEAFNVWLEENEDYSGQGHRRNMLSNKYKYIGIAHVERDGCHFWVQEFADAKSGSGVTAALDGPATKPVIVANEYISSYLAEEEDGEDFFDISVRYGDSYELNNINECISAAAITDVCIGTFEPPIERKKASGFKSSDDKIFTVSGNTLTANNVGTARLLTNSSMGGELSMPITVSACYISYANVTLDKKTYEYTGKEITPGITITYKGKTLTEGKDYTVDFSKNTEPGFATVKITGIGNFTGTTMTTFYINKPASTNQSGDNSDAAKNDKDSDNNNSNDSGKEKNSPEMAGKLRDDGSAGIINHVIYTVNGTNAVVSGFDEKISSYTAPKYVTISGKTYKVTSIGSYAFNNLTSLKKVDLSKSEITKIGSNAFAGCSNLKTVKLNAAKQKTVSSNAFKNISSKAKCTIKAKDKKTYKQLVKKLKKAGLKKASFKMKKG